MTITYEFKCYKDEQTVLFIKKDLTEEDVLKNFLIVIKNIPKCIQLFKLYKKESNFQSFGSQATSLFVPKDMIIQIGTTLKVNANLSMAEEEPVIHIDENHISRPSVATVEACWIRDDSAVIYQEASTGITNSISQLLNRIEVLEEQVRVLMQSR